MHRQLVKEIEFQKVTFFDVSSPSTTLEPVVLQVNTPNISAKEASTNLPRRSQRALHLLECFVLGLDFVLLTNSGEPSCYKEAMLAQDKPKWELAMKSELQSIEKNKT